MPVQARDVVDLRDPKVLLHELDNMVELAVMTAKACTIKLKPVVGETIATGIEERCIAVMRGVRARVEELLRKVEG